VAARATSCGRPIYVSVREFAEREPSVHANANALAAQCGSIRAQQPSSHCHNQALPLVISRLRAR
jgi:hypothetical protein